MNGSFEIDLTSWPKLAQVLKEEGSSATGLLDQVLAVTTDPAACGAADGLAGVDAAVTIMLMGFNEVMTGNLVPALADGFDVEAGALIGTGKIYQDMDAEAAQSAAQTFQGGA